MAIKVNNTTVIDDSYNISNIATATATSFVGDGSGLTNLPVAEGGTITATASGTLPNGAPVVVNSNGTVSAISSTGTESTVTSGTTTVSTNMTQINSVYDPVSDKIIIAYDAGTAIRVVVGAVSGSTITFGTPTVISSASTQNLMTSKSMDIDYNYGIVLIGYERHYSGIYTHMAYVAGRVVGMQISLGDTITDSSAVNAGNIASSHNSPDGDSDFGEGVAVAYIGTNQYYTMWVASYIVSPSSNASLQARVFYVPHYHSSYLEPMDLGYGSNRQLATHGEVYYHSAAGMDIAAAIDTYQNLTTDPLQALIVWRNEAQDILYYNMVAMSSTTNLTSGSRQQFSNWSNTITKVTGLSATSTDQTNNRRGMYIVTTGQKYSFVTVGNPNSTGFNVASTFQDMPIPTGFSEMNLSSNLSLAHKPGSDQIIVVATQSNSSYPDTHNKLFAVEFSYSNSSLTAVSHKEISADYFSHYDITYDDVQDKYVITASGSSSTDPSTTFLYEPDNISSNLTSDNFIGYSDASYSNGQTATIQIIGSVDDKARIISNFRPSFSEKK